MQLAYLNSTARLNIAACGRRSFKSESLKRRTWKAALASHKHGDAQFFLCAPTQQQAKDIFWRDTKLAIPDWAFAHDRRRSISDSELRIDLFNGACIRIAGLDKPARIEGGDWDGGGIDEYGDCRAEVFEEHVRPMMMRGGWCDRIGVPAGRNHYYDQSCQIMDGKIPDAQYHHWSTEEVLHLWLGQKAAEAEIAEARSTMDTLAYNQEYHADWVSFEGAAYYAYDSEFNLAPKGQRVNYQKGKDLWLLLDFNRRPGIALIAQPQQAPDWLKKIAPVPADGIVYAVIDEVFIKQGSNTSKVCREFARRWAPVHTEGNLRVYGDPAGGAKTAQGVQGSDWDLVRAVLKPIFQERLKMRVAKSHPAIRSRVNAVNSRLVSVDGTVGTIIDGKRCPYFVRDLEGVEADDTGDIIKPKGSLLTHLSDAWGYGVHKERKAGGQTIRRRAA